jgi:hypothetical protein
MKNLALQLRTVLGKPVGFTMYSVAEAVGTKGETWAVDGKPLRGTGARAAYVRAREVARPLREDDHSPSGQAKKLRNQSRQLGGHLSLGHIERSIAGRARQFEGRAPYPI